MDDEELAEAIDAIIQRFIVRTSSSVVKQQLAVDTFISIAALTLTAPEIAVIAEETATISISLEAMINDVLKSYENSVAAGAQMGVADVQRRKGADEMWTWQTESERPCPDCNARSGAVATYAYWESVGLPKDGSTICGSRCMCRLIPA